MDVAAHIADWSQVSRQLELPGPELLPARLMRAVAEALPVAAAGISVFSTDGHRVPLGASDDTAALAERLQFTVGEGPCLSVHGTGQALLATGEVMARRWPAFHSELLGRTPFRSILSIPLDQPGLGGDAAMDLYYQEPDRALDAEQLERVQDAVDVTAALLVTDPADTAGVIGAVWLDSAAALGRQRMWTALGMINVGLHLNTVDA